MLSEEANSVSDVLDKSSSKLYKVSNPNISPFT
jgi:hypothetical protein